MLHYFRMLELLPQSHSCTLMAGHVLIDSPEITSDKVPPISAEREPHLMTSMRARSGLYNGLHEYTLR